MPRPPSRHCWVLVWRSKRRGRTSQNRDARQPDTSGRGKRQETRGKREENKGCTFFPCLLPLASCLLPLASCLLPLGSWLSSLASCPLPLASEQGTSSMGRMLDAFKHGRPRHGTDGSSSPALNAIWPEDEPEEGRAEEDIPFIEVGGPPPPLEEKLTVAAVLPSAVAPVAPPVSDPRWM